MPPVRVINLKSQSWEALGEFRSQRYKLSRKVKLQRGGLFTRAVFPFLMQLLYITPLFPAGILDETLKNTAKRWMRIRIGVGFSIPG